VFCKPFLKISLFNIDLSKQAIPPQTPRFVGVFTGFAWGKPWGMWGKLIPVKVRKCPFFRVYVNRYSVA
jgi:hypothetical protein